MQNISQWFSGKKTYLVAAVIFCLGGAKALGWIDEDSYQTLLGLLGGLGLAALRHGVTK